MTHNAVRLRNRLRKLTNRDAANGAQLSHIQMYQASLRYLCTMLSHSVGDQLKLAMHMHVHMREHSKMNASANSVDQYAYLHIAGSKYIYVHK
jgi:hypothetical protein